MTIFGRSIIYAEWAIGRSRVRDHSNDNDSEMALVQVESGGAMKWAWYVLQRVQGMTKAPPFGQAGRRFDTTHMLPIFSRFLTDGPRCHGPRSLDPWSVEGRK